MTDWTERTVEIPLSFLGAGRYDATIFADGTNANRAATDYRITTQTVDKGGRVTVTLKQGGGAVIRLTPAAQ